MSGAEKKTRMPVVSCIGSIGDDGCSVEHNWANATDVDSTEMLCQVIVTSVRLGGGSRSTSAIADQNPVW